MFVGMNSDVFINKLLKLGVVERVRIGWYKICVFDPNMIYNRDEIVERFATEVAPGRYEFKLEEVERYTPRPSVRPTRRIYRAGYQTQSRNVTQALERIPVDADGVRRSYGIEYEINALTSEEESELAYLLDTLPPHVTERDGSLSSSGVEIVFEPLGREDTIKVVKKLREFVRVNCIDMNCTGMHITVGVSNSEVSSNDLTIRTNRLALAVKSVALQTEIIKVFGRDFVNYARLPEGLLDTIRYRAFKVRNSNCWECRLVRWDCDIERVMEFLDVAEPLFHRAFEAQDFINLFRVFGSNTDRE